MSAKNFFSAETMQAFEKIFGISLQECQSTYIVGRFDLCTFGEKAGIDAYQNQNTLEGGQWCPNMNHSIQDLYGDDGWCLFSFVFENRDNLLIP